MFGVVPRKIGDDQTMLIPNPKPKPIFNMGMSYITRALPRQSLQRQWCWPGPLRTIWTTCLFWKLFGSELGCAYKISFHRPVNAQCHRKSLGKMPHGSSQGRLAWMSSMSISTFCSCQGTWRGHPFLGWIKMNVCQSQLWAWPTVGEDWFYPSRECRGPSFVWSTWTSIKGLNFFGTWVCELAGVPSAKTLFSDRFLVAK